MNNIEKFLNLFVINLEVHLETDTEKSKFCIYGEIQKSSVLI